MIRMSEQKELQAPKEVQDQKEVQAPKAEKKKNLSQLKNSINKMEAEQASLQEQLKKINAKKKELSDKIQKTKASKAKLKEEMVEAERKRKAAEKKRNRPLRKRYLLEAAQAFLDEFPSLKKTFYSSITKEDYSTNGGNLKEQFVEIANYWKSTHPVNAIPEPKPVPTVAPEEITPEPAPALTLAPEEGTPEQSPVPAAAPEEHEPIKKEETPPHASGVNFTKFNSLRLPEDAKDVPNKCCPECGAPAITWVSKRYNKRFYGCKNSRFFNLGSANCEFHSPRLEDLKDVPDVDAK